MGRHTFLVASLVRLVALARPSIDGTYALLSSRDAGAARLGHAQQAISSPRCRDAMPPVDGPLPKMCSGTVMRGGERSRARARPRRVHSCQKRKRNAWLHPLLAHFESIRSAKGAAATTASATRTVRRQHRRHAVGFLIAYRFDRRPTLPQRVTCVVCWNRTRPCTGRTAGPEARGSMRGC